MFYSKSVVVLATLFATFSDAVPVSENLEVTPRKLQTISITQVKNKKHHKAPGPVALAKAVKKYGGVLSHELSAAVIAASASGSVSATPQDAYDSEYLSPVTIGTPGQTLMLDFDTGSADLWVFSTETPSSEVNGQTLYNPASSSTSAKKSGYTWAITYGDGSGSKGDVYADKVVVGGVTATSQAVEAATSVSSSFTSDTSNDGLLGLAFSTINTVSPTSQNTFFDTVKSSLTSPLFAVSLKKGAAGTYDFGYIDTAKYTGSISYTSVNTGNGFWEIAGNGYAVGTGSFVSLSIDAIVDTGTTLLLIPASAAKAYWAKVSGSSYSNTQGGYIFPCSATLPSFTFGVGSYRGVIPGTYMNYAPVSTSTCYGGIQPDTGIGFSIYGDILLKAQYVVFDSGNTRVGFAAKTL